MILQIFKISFRALLSNKARSFLTMLGIIIGVTSVILMVSIGDGLKQSIQVQLSNFGSNQIFIMPGNITGGEGPGMTVNKLNFDDSDLISEEIDSVNYSAAIIEQYANIKYKGKSIKLVDIIGTTAVYRNIATDKVIKGRFFSEGEDKSGLPVVVIGPTVAKDLFLNSSPIGKSIIIYDTKFTVIGLLESKGSMLGVDIDKRAYIPLNVFRRIAGAKNPTSIMVKAKTGSDVTPEFRISVSLN